METTPLSRGRIIGSILLIAGNSIGAGMLALPVLTGPAGLVPALVSLVAAWLFMFATSLLLLEVNLSLHVGASLISMAGRTLGKAGKVASWMIWSFLFYLLLIAFLTAIGSMAGELLHTPPWIATCFFALLFGSLVYLGTKVVDVVNRVLMVGLFAAYLLMLFFGLPHVGVDRFAYREWRQIFLTLPVLTISFGFHNAVPSLVPYLHGKVELLRKVLLFGSFIPLVIYALFEIVVLGSVPTSQLELALQQGKSAAEALASFLGASWFSTTAIFFAFFALATSFIAIALSFVHFLADGFKMPFRKSREHPGLVILVLLPPLLVALVDPSAFLTALSLAGAFGAVTLFGIMPALMAWQLRYRLQEQARVQLFGGRIMLIWIILCSIGVMLCI